MSRAVQGKDLRTTTWYGLMAIFALSVWVGCALEDTERTLEPPHAPSKAATPPEPTRASASRTSTKHTATPATVTRPRTMDVAPVVADHITETLATRASNALLQQGMVEAHGRVAQVERDAVQGMFEDLPARGATSPHVTVVMFGDFQCPFSRRAANNLARVVEQSADDVRVVFAQLPQPYHDRAQRAAEASLAAHAQGRFWDYHDALWTLPGRLSDEVLRAHARDVGLDLERFDADLAEGRFRAVVEAQMAWAHEHGIRATPGFLINGRSLSGVLSLDSFKTTLDEARSRAQRVSKETGLQGDALHAVLFRNATRAHAPPPMVPAAATRQAIPLDPSASRGPADAPITVVAFSSFQCRFCARAQTTLEALREMHPDTLRVVFKHQPLERSKDAELAHRAVIAAGAQGAFWPMHDRLFKHVGPLDEATIRHHAGQLNLNVSRLIEALDDRDTSAAIERDRTLARQIHVYGAPHFFINGVRLSGAQHLGAFRATIERELQLAQQLLEQGVPPANLYSRIVGDPFPVVPQPIPPREVDPQGAPSLGPADAPVTIIMFCDYHARFCHSAQAVVDEARTRHPGKTRLVFKHLPLPTKRGTLRDLAAQSAVAAHAQGRFWPYHRALLAHEGQITRETLEAIAAEVGLDMVRFNHALDTERFKADVARDARAAHDAGLSGTPSFLINGEKRVGAQPVDAFDRAIQAALR